MLWWKISNGYSFIQRLRIARMCFREACLNKHFIPNAHDISAVSGYMWRSFMNERMFQKQNDNQ